VCGGRGRYTEGSVLRLCLLIYWLHWLSKLLNSSETWQKDWMEREFESNVEWRVTPCYLSYQTSQIQVNHISTFFFVQINSAARICKLAKWIKFIIAWMFVINKFLNVRPMRLTYLSFFFFFCILRVYFKCHSTNVINVFLKIIQMAVSFNRCLLFK